MIIAIFATMKKILITLFVVGAAMPAASQRNPLRDSLSQAIRLMEEYPDSVDLRLKKAGWNMQLMEWQYAKDEYDVILRRHPENVTALFFRAYANERLGRYNFARLDYQNLLALLPGDFHASLGLSLLNQKDHHYTEALDGINRLVEAYPDSAVAYAARGGMEKERGSLELAEDDYEQAWKLDRHTTDYLINLIDVRIRMGKREEALDSLHELERMGFPRRCLDAFYRRLR